MIGGGSKLDEDQIDGTNSNPTNKFNSRSIMSNTTKFRLTNRSDSDMPINSRSIKLDNNLGGKISKLIAPKSTEKTYSLCKLYDESLREQEEKPVLNQQIVEQEKSRKYNFMMSKLL